MSADLPNNPGAVMAGIEFAELTQSIVKYLTEVYPVPMPPDEMLRFYLRARAFTQACEAAAPAIRDIP